MCRDSVRLFVLVSLAVAAALAGCDKAPTAPERHGIPAAMIVCDSAPSGDVTQCRAPVYCNLYSCPAGTPTDVTQVVVWSVDDPAVARIVSPGMVQAVGLGHTLLRVKWEGHYSDYWIAVGVFPGTAPLHTYEYEGTVWDGEAPARTPLDGARVEILNGRPGAILVRSPGHYAFFGIPSGTYRLRVSREGYVTQELETRQFADVTLRKQ